MSITAETAKQHANDPAVLCCRAEAGITIEAANLEDPAIFDELVDSGLLTLDGCLKIKQVLGAKLTKTCDSLSPLTVGNVEGWKDDAGEEAPAQEPGGGSRGARSRGGCRFRRGRSHDDPEWESCDLDQGREGYLPGTSDLMVRRRRKNGVKNPLRDSMRESCKRFVAL